MTKKIIVDLKDKKYTIWVGSGILSRLGETVSSLDIGSDAVIVTNSLIRKLYGPQVQNTFLAKNISVKFFEVPDSEKSKSQRIAFRLIEDIARYDINKKIFIVALGGGVVGDLAGFVAAVYKRGVPLVQVPTTFLAQIDSAIGGKVAIDLPVAKNLIGAFCQPRLVFSDVAVLKTLSKRQLRNGLAEAIKYGAIKDRALFDFIEKNCLRVLKADVKILTRIVCACSAIKSSIIAKDEKETLGLRTVLNFGHTIGHGIEAACSYGCYQHGEAVALGMRVATALSVKLNLLSCAEQKKLEKLLTKAGLPQQVQKVKAAAILRSIAHDKKNTSKGNRFVLLKKIGVATIVEGIFPELIQAVLEEYQSSER